MLNLLDAFNFNPPIYINTGKDFFLYYMKTFFKPCTAALYSRKDLYFGGGDKANTTGQDNIVQKDKAAAHGQLLPKR